MATTTITGTINGVNNTALANKWITFRLVQLGTDSGATATVAQSVDSVQTDANGDFSIDVWNNGDSGKTSVLEITVDGSKAESVIIPTGTASIELWDLIENYQADGSTSEQVPVVSDLFLRKSTNLSDLGDAPTARTNLGVKIGTDVQAHSATLDATTASFTTADETKLDGIEALADVTDATNIAASGGYVAGGTDVALTDGGTGASDAPTARANLGVPSESDTLLKSGNLLGLTDTAAARANLGVPSTSEGLAIANNLSELTATASTARTNINVPSNSEAVLVANNLSDVDPATARANLGVTSSADALSISGNLSELTPTSSTARTNLGVAIGSDVQAHSAVLDATDASFTTAKDAAISANTANIASNDTDIGVLTGQVFQNQAAIALNTPAIALNTAKVTNATHTGDVTGDLELTIAPSAVDIANLSANGTPDATKFLRGDNTWSVPDGGAGGDVSTDAIWDAKGDLAGGTGPNAATRLPLGTDLQVLTVNSAEPTGMEWTTLPSGAGGVATDPVWDAKGDIAAGTGLDTADRLAVGTNSQVLTADSAEATGMKWSTPSTVANDPVWDAKGDLVAGTAADASSRLAIGTDAQVLTVDSASPTGMKWAASAAGGSVATDPIWTAKGNIIAASGPNACETVLIGSDNQVLTASSIEPTGMVWKTVPDGKTVATDPIWNAKGDLAASTGPDASDRLAIGLDTQVLTADSSQPTGMKWAAPAPAPVPAAETEYPYTTDFQSGAAQTRDLSVLDNSSGYNANVNLTSIYVGSKINTIGFEAFKGATGLLDFTLSKNVGIIDGGAFSGCTSLVNVVIPDTVDVIASFSFENCTSLVSCLFPDDQITVGSSIFNGCVSLASFTFPSSTTSIGSSAFGGCTSLTTVDIPASVGLIGAGAFINCSSLSEINIYADTAPSIGALAFSGVAASVIKVPFGSTGYAASYDGIPVVEGL